MPPWDALVFPQESACHLCGRFPEGRDVLCRACLAEMRALRLPIGVSRVLPVLSGSMAAYMHSGAARRMVHCIKYQHDPALASLMGRHMAEALDASLADVAIPVPLHSAREAQRGYNQADLLARAVCGHVPLRCETGALRRIRPTDSQVWRSRRERLEAMADAFAVPSPYLVRCKRVLLVDDVVTTGATAIACANALLGAGAKEVWLLTFCRA